MMMIEWEDDVYIQQMIMEWEEGGGNWCMKTTMCLSIDTPTIMLSVKMYGCMVLFLLCCWSDIL